ncbi:MAG: protoheme IX farnesyltransferase [Bacteroidetes bacterium]|nr:protoheme IX farnesyltransferase [Bacteroidota bacterium]
MLQAETAIGRVPALLIGRARDYSQLLKPNLSFMVVFSSVIGYLLAPGISFQLTPVLELFIGGMLVTGGANTLNQIIERETDALMHRTQNRPLPAGRMMPPEAVIVACSSGLIGSLLITVAFNPLAGLLSLLSLGLYAFAYTPMKRIHPISVFIGALPGAMPPLIGWVAATGHMGLGGWILFLIQFFWQFPHYWAIAWVCFEDYARAGFRMLPSYEGKTRFTGLQCMFYSIVLVPLLLLPRLIGMSGNWSMYISIGCGILYFIASVLFYLKNDKRSAKMVMFGSFIYLPVVLLALYFDKF